MTDATTSQPAPAKPKRSRVERVLVQGGIGVLLILVVIEGISYSRMLLAHTQLLAELKKAETQDYRLTGDKVRKILGGRTPDWDKVKRAHGTEERYEVYYFSGLLKQRELCVHYSAAGKKNDPEVMEVTTVIPEELLFDDGPVAKSPPPPNRSTLPPGDPTAGDAPATTADGANSDPPTAQSSADADQGAVAPQELGAEVNAASDGPQAN